MERGTRREDGSIVVAPGAGGDPARRGDRGDAGRRSLGQSTRVSSLTGSGNDPALRILSSSAAPLRPSGARPALPGPSGPPRARRIAAGKQIRERARQLARVVVVALLLAWCHAVAAAATGEEPRRPLAFEANRGQADEPVKFLARAAGYTLFLTPAEAVLALGDASSGRVVLRLTPVDASPARIAADGPLPGVAHYAGRLPGTASIGAPTYARVTYAGIYSAIDLVYYGRGHELEYDFVVAPGADPGRIALAFGGATRVEIDGGGDLRIHTAAGELRQPRPVAYQEIDGKVLAEGNETNNCQASPTPIAVTQ